MKRLSFLIVVALSGTVACSNPEPGDACLGEDLGRFSLVTVRRSEAGRACSAEYKDKDGKLVQVRVGDYSPGSLAQAGSPAKFEKHMVLSRRQGDGLKVSWYSDHTAVEIDLPGSVVPEGPVLRAYLYRYPSRVTDEVRATRQDVVALRQSSREAPGDARVHLELARKYRKLGDTVMAAQEYHIAVDKNPKCYSCYLEMGTLYRQLRHWDLSIRALRKAAALDPKAHKPWLELGDVSYDVRNRQEALRGYTRALELGIAEPDRSRAEKRLAELHDGKFMIQVLPGAQTPKQGPADGGSAPDGS